MRLSPLKLFDIFAPYSELSTQLLDNITKALNKQLLFQFL